MSLNICITLVQSNHPNISCITSSRLEVASPLNISLNMTRSTASLTNLKTPAWERCFVHSRLLERSAKLSYNLGGSSKLSSHPLAHSSSQDQHVWTILIAPMSSSNIQHLHPYSFLKVLRPSHTILDLGWPTSHPHIHRSH